MINSMQMREEPTCYICLEPVGKRLCQIACDHVFHRHCIEFWLHMKNRCPVCNREKPMDIDLSCTLRGEEMEKFLEDQRAWKSFDLSDVKIYFLKGLAAAGEAAKTSLGRC